MNPIRFTLLAAALATCAALPAMAQGIAPANPHAGHGAHGAAPSKPAAAGGMVDAEVRKVDTASGKVTLRHGAIEHLGMPAMTMAFRVKDAAWLGQIKEGDRVRVRVDKVDGSYVVTALEPAT